MECTLSGASTVRTAWQLDRTRLFHLDLLLSQSSWAVPKPQGLGKAPMDAAIRQANKRAASLEPDSLILRFVTEVSATLAIR